MTEPNAVPLIVLSPARDPVEAINSTLRRAGHPVHCTWIPALRDLADAIAQINPELLVHVAGSEDLRGVIAVRNQVAPKLPVIGAADTADENRIVEAMQLGARDFVSLSSTARLQAVMLRELRAFRLEARVGEAGIVQVDGRRSAEADREVAAQRYARCKRADRARAVTLRRPCQSNKRSAG